MKELNVAAGFGACVLSLPAVGGCAAPSSADMVVDDVLNARLCSPTQFHLAFGGDRPGWLDRWTFMGHALASAWRGPCPLPLSRFFSPSRTVAVSPHPRPHTTTTHPAPSHSLAISISSIRSFTPL